MPIAEHPEEPPMSIAEETPRRSPDEYLGWEKAQEGKHEYVDGEAFAMALGRATLTQRWR